MRPINARVALIGAGTIGARYVESLRQNPGFEVLSVCSQNDKSAETLAEQHDLRASSLEAILSDPAINYILNLTPAGAHAATTRACLQAGKSVYSEKPLAGTLDEADELIELAARHHLLLACAPATFLWPPLATARRLVKEGQLGAISGALTTLVYPGPELFHPSPSHLYSATAGPLRDMGVYQITALMALLGPVIRVSAMASKAKSERKVRVGSDAGQSFSVCAPTHIHAQLLHARGTISSLIISFDGISASQPQLHLFGHAAGLRVSDFHAPDATVTLRGPGRCEETVVDQPQWLSSTWAIGPVSAWKARHSGRPVETSAYRARAVLEVLLGVEEAAANGCPVQIMSSKEWI